MLSATGKGLYTARFCVCGVLLTPSHNQAIRAAVSCMHAACSSSPALRGARPALTVGLLICWSLQSVAGRCCSYAALVGGAVLHTVLHAAAVPAVVHCFGTAPACFAAALLCLACFCWLYAVLLVFLGCSATLIRAMLVFLGCSSTLIRATLLALLLLQRLHHPVTVLDTEPLCHSVRCR